MQNSKAPHIKSQNPYERVQASDGLAIAREIEAQRKLMEQQIEQANPEFTRTVFDLSQHKESYERPKQIAEIQQLVEQIRHEVKDIKSHSEGLNAEVEQIEKVTLQSLPDKPGLYHIRYLEIVLAFLKGLKAKVGEAKTWLMAMQSKKAKRGSAFLANSKKLGTKYSLSQELSSARNVQ